MGSDEGLTRIVFDIFKTGNQFSWASQARFAEG